MTNRTWILTRPASRFATAALSAVLVLAAVVLWSLRTGATETRQPAPKESGGTGLQMANGTLIVPIETVRSMRLEAVPIRGTNTPRSLRLTGQLMLDVNRLTHVTSRFTGEVVSIGAGATEDVPLRIGQRVEKGQLLAVLWSKEIGEKKSDLVDALSQLYLHQAIYRRMQDLSSPGAIPQRTIDEMQRNFESDVIQVERLKRTLISWRISEEELKAIENEAQRLHQQPLAAPSTLVDDNAASLSHWADIQIRAPISGTILERNLNVGDVVSADLDLFKIADLSKLVVMANIYEDDLPALLAIPATERSWKVFISSRPTDEPLSGAIESVGNIIDPNQHTAVVQGSLDNSHGDFRVGQFVEAVIEIPESAPGWEVPLSALIDSGNASRVILAVSDDLTRLRPMDVRVVRRTSSVARVVSMGGELKEGDRLLTTGGQELMNATRTIAPSPASEATKN
ncbi:MAG: efflux RND transporter periplasmic adaptor subunit [Pirellulales bacterium]